MFEQVLGLEPHGGEPAGLGVPLLGGGWDSMIKSERRAKAVKKNTRAAIWRTLQFSRAGMTVFFRLLNAATSLSGSRAAAATASSGRNRESPLAQRSGFCKRRPRREAKIG